MSGSRNQACNHCQYTLLIASGHLRCFCSESFDFAAGRLLPGLFNQRESSVLCQLCCSMTSVNDGAGLKLGKFAAQLRHLPEQSQITASSLHLPRFCPTSSLLHDYSEHSRLPARLRLSGCPLAAEALRMLRRHLVAQLSAVPCVSVTLVSFLLASMHGSNCGKSRLHVCDLCSQSCHLPAHEPEHQKPVLCSTIAARLCHFRLQSLDFVLQLLSRCLHLQGGLFLRL